MRRSELEGGLKPLLKKRVDLPFTTDERTFGDSRKRLLLIMLGLDLALILAVFLILLSAGAMPSLHRDPDVTVPPGFERTMWLVIFWIGFGFLAFGVALTFFLTGFRPTPADRPWRYDATEGGLVITTADGRIASGPWADWRLSRYGVFRYRGSTAGVTWMEILHRDQPMIIDLKHCRRARKLAALLLQRTTSD
jgi:hypothetical protein